ncbi:MAG: hypothetical protein A2Z75_05330 [Chloroflexi bacterium RBG_13_50_10]|nr:MAG: hypothetical protein A2Z75_05330 [Chloroflexi bacterium RBG_13_50_10]
MDYKDNPSEYLASISPERVKTVRYPRQSWKGRARCFRLFDNGLTPSDISPRQCKVSRRTLYRYYQDWKILKARLKIALLKSKQELAKRYGTERVITIRNIRS